MSDGAIDLLSTLPSSTGLPALQRAAVERLRETGFPGRKHERWRFTSVRDVVSTAFAPIGDVDVASAIERASAILGNDDSVRVYIVNGRAATNVVAKGVTFASAAGDPNFGAVARLEHFAALNTALHSDALRVSLGEVDAPLHLVHVSVGGTSPVASYPRVLIAAEPRSRATVIETYLALDREVLTNAVTEIVLAPDARLDHTRAVHGSDAAFHLGYVAVRQAERSEYDSRLATFGGALSRVELDVALVGEGAIARLDGVYHVRDTEHVDHQIAVDHVAPGCESRVRYRGLLDGRGHAVFNAIGWVRRDAQQSSAHQENNNLLLSDDAIIDTKPHLEIEADDVSASHGATIGAIDETQLFYLRSRGMREEEARDVLTYAFVCALLDPIPHPATQRRLEAAVLARLPYGARLRELSR